MNNTISISLLQEKPCAAVFLSGGPVLVPGKSTLPNRFAAVKADAAAVPGIRPENAVVVVPSSHTLQQRRALLREAREAGLKISRFLTAPAAAALMDYSRKSGLYESHEDRLALICSLSGSFFDAAVAALSQGVIEILATGFTANATPRNIETALRQVLNAPEIGGRTFHRVLMIGDSYYVPGIQDWIRSFVTTDTLTGVYGVEEAALGGAVQCGLLQGQQESPLLMNALTYSLGIKTEGGSFTPLIQRNTIYPCQIKQTFTNARSEQTEYQVWLYEGEEAKASDNHLVSGIRITGADPCPAGAAQIELSLNVDTNGFLRLDAKDLATGRTLALEMSTADTGSLLMLPCQKAAAQEPPAPQSPVSEEALVLKFLPVYDDLLLALEQPTSDEAFKKGVRLTMKRLTGIFREQGVEFYAERGESFDPKLHNAVMHMQSPQYGENTIVKVLQKGVKLNGKIIRYAMVQVAN